MSKNQESEFDLLDREILNSVPNLRIPGGPGQPILDRADLFHKLQDARKNVLKELGACSDLGPSGPRIRYDAGADAKALLDGTEVSSLTAPAEGSRRGALLRQLRALEGALPAAQTQIAIEETRVILEQCEKLRPLAQGFVQDKD